MGGHVCSTIRGNNLEETRTEISGNIYSARRYGSDEQCHWYLEPPWEEYLLTFDIVRNKVRCNDGDFQILGKQFCNTNHKCAYYSMTNCPSLPVDARCAEIPRNNNLPHLEVHFEGLRNAVNNGGFNLNYEFHSCPDETTTNMGTTTGEMTSTPLTTEVLTTTTDVTTPEILAQTTSKLVPTPFASTTAENIAQTTQDFITTAFEITNTEDTAHTTPDLISTTIETTQATTFPTTEKILSTVQETTAQNFTSTLQYTTQTTTEETTDSILEYTTQSTPDYTSTAFEVTSGESINLFPQATQESITTALETTSEESLSTIPLSTQDYMTTILETTTPENIDQSTKDFITTTIETTTTGGFSQTTRDFITTTIETPIPGNFVHTTKEIMTSVIDENKETDIQLTTLLSTPTNRMSPREGPDPGILAGIIICGIIFVTLITILMLILVRRKKLKKLKIQNGHEMQSSSQKKNGPTNTEMKPEYEAVPKVAESALAPGFVLANNQQNKSPHSDHTYVTTPHQQRNGTELHNKINMPIKTANSTDLSTKQASSTDLIYNGIGNPCVFSYENKAYDNSHDDSSQSGTLSFISSASSVSGDSYDSDSSDEEKSQDGIGDFGLNEASFDIYSEQNMRNEILSTKVTKM